MSKIVETRSGPLSGIESGGVHTFLGIPFAAPPVGDLRFAPPAPPAPWTGTRDCSSPGLSCPQIPAEGSFGKVFATALPTGDDCLNLNVWTPDPHGAGLPVLVWIHGGAFQAGSGGEPIYSGQSFARDGVVCVTINYRLGVQGFLHVGEATTGGSPGLLDQIAALEWVQENITSFGGDPGNVTIAGESAGGMSVGALMAAPPARGLFRRAVAQSGAAHNGMSPGSAEGVASYVAELLGIDVKDLGALRAFPLDRLLEVEKVVGTAGLTRREAHRWPELAAEASTMVYQPVWGTAALPERPIDVIWQGSAAGIDLLVGTTADEMGGLLRVAGETMGVQPGGDIPVQLVDAIAGMIFGFEGPAAASALLEYRSARPGAANIDVLGAVMTDWTFRIPAIRLAEAQAKHGSVYAYRFGWPTPAFDGHYGAGHGLELPFVFDTASTELGVFLAGDGAPAELIGQVHSAWVAFCHTGDPGHAGLPPWATYDVNGRATMRLDVPSAIELDPDPSERMLWEGRL